MRKAALVALALSLFVVACKKPAPVAAPDAGAPPAEMRTFVLAGDNVPRRALWTANEDILVVTASSLVHLTPRTPARPPRVIPFGRGSLQVATARAEDLTVVMTDEGEVFSVRGGEARPLARTTRTGRLEVSDNGLVVAVGEVTEHGAGTAFYDADRATLRGHTHHLYPSLSPSGRFAMMAGRVIRTEGYAPTVVEVDDIEPVGWHESRAVFGGPSALSLVDPESRRLIRVPLPCDGPSTLDREHRRVVRRCLDRLVFVALDKLARFEIPYRPAKQAFDHHGVLFAREGPDAFLHFFEDGPRRLRFDVASRTVTDIGMEPVALRTKDGRHTSGAFIMPGDAFPSPSGEFLMLFDDALVIVTDRAMNQVLRFGVPSVSPGAESIAGIVPRAGGLDVLTRRDDRHEQLVRIGPDAAPRGEESAVAAEGEECGREQRRLARGTLRFDPEIEYGAGVACLCTNAGCETLSIPLHLAVVEGTAERLVAVTRHTRDTQVHLLGPDGAPGPVVMIEERCNRARVALDEKSVALVCRGNDGEKDAEQEIVEVAFDPPSILRRTPYRSRKQERSLAAAGRSYLFDRGEYFTLDARVLEAGTGRTFANVHAWQKSGIVQFSDGRVELFGDTEVAAERVLCLDGDSILPLRRCREAVMVNGRFRFD